MATTRDIVVSADIPGLQGESHVHAVDGSEAVSRPFFFDVELSANDLDLDSARGTLAQVSIRDGFGEQRYIWGVIESATAISADESWTRYVVRLAPQPYVLAYRRGFRIFQAQSVPEIVKKVFGDAGLPAALFDWSGVTGSYPTREYTVQYDESEWAFVCRLLEEEGIFFAFHHDASGHVMVLGDSSPSAPDLSPSTIDYGEAGSLTSDGAFAWDWSDEAEVTVSKVVLNDYNMENPKAALLVEKKKSESIEVEWYEHPGRFGQPSVGTRLAASRLDALRASRSTARLRTNVIAVQPGRIFELLGNARVSGKFFVTSSVFSVRAHDRDANAGQGWTMQLQVSVLPASQDFRPPRVTPRPRVIGLQTARVTGPAGQELHCDEHGRVKLQFAWDLEGALDDKSSCWIRVTQAHTTGSIMIPRVGWEVLVEFIDGDPDRPICFGKVYNPMQPPPYTLPNDKAISGHKSNSSPGGGGVNEVSFDDTAGSQLVKMSGHANVSVKAGNNKKAKVANNAGRTVGAKRTAQIGANETVAVKGSQNELVVGSHTQSIGASRLTKVSGQVAEEITASHTISVGGTEMLQVGNPAAAVLQIVTAAAISAAAGAAASAASRAQASALGPLGPALATAQGHLGSAQRFLGAAGSLFGASPAPGGGPDASASAPEGHGGAGPAAGAGPTAVAGVPDAGAMAAGAAASVLSGELAKAGIKAAGAAAAGGGGGGGGAGASVGSGVWSTTVGGDVTESIGALASINSAYGVTMAVGAASTEMIGAARIELIKGGKSESTGGAKLETVGVYVLNASGGASVTAKGAIAVNVAASMRQNIAKGHGMTAKGAANVTVSKLDLTGSTGVTFKCGAASIVVNGSGVMIKGTQVTLQAPTIEVKATNIGSV